MQNMRPAIEHMLDGIPKAEAAIFRTLNVYATAIPFFPEEDKNAPNWER